MIGPVDDSWYTREEGLKERQSAGGVVVRIDKGNLLLAMIREISSGQTLEGYVLPKGGLEEGEDIETGALREIEEEAGLTEVTRLCDLPTLERYSDKKVYWSINHYGLYYTEQLSGEILDKEHHFDFGWFRIDDLPDMFWPDERKMLLRERKRITDYVIAHQNPKGRKVGFM